MPRDQAGPGSSSGTRRGPLARFALPAAPHRHGGGGRYRAWLRDPASVEAYEVQRELGDSPSDETLMDARLVPTRARCGCVYQTNSTHKSMSAIRQGSMLLVKDVDFHTVEAQFREGSSRTPRRAPTSN